MLVELVAFATISFVLVVLVLVWLPPRDTKIFVQTNGASIEPSIHSPPQRPIKSKNPTITYDDDMLGELDVRRHIPSVNVARPDDESIVCISQCILRSCGHLYTYARAYICVIYIG